MELTKEQIQAIIDDIVSKMEAVIENPCNGDYSDLECYEDDYGHCYDFGSHSFESELEEICIDGLPGISKDDSDICITASYDVDLSFHDDYDPGDYWTPPAGGIEIDEVRASISKVDIDISVFNKETEDYEEIKVSEKQKKYIIDKVNEKICPTSNKVVA